VFTQNSGLEEVMKGAVPDFMIFSFSQLQSSAVAHR
jgi:hypothetical protein